jgi:hypothetical protein
MKENLDRKVMDFIKTKYNNCDAKWLKPIHFHQNIAMLQDLHYATPYNTMSSNTLPFEYSPILVWQLLVGFIQDHVN